MYTVTEKITHPHRRLGVNSALQHINKLLRTEADYLENQQTPDGGSRWGRPDEIPEMLLRGSDGNDA
jgi:hypothetical protein